jgi:hypothetical protein
MAMSARSPTDHDIGRTHALVDLLANLFQDHVADLVPVAVVDLVELVDVEQEDADRGIAAAHLGDQRSLVVLEEASVVEPGQGS